VARVPAIHDALCEVDAAARHIQIRIDVVYEVYGTSIQTHAQSNFWKRVQRLTEFHSAPGRSLWVAAED
jgi:hypothetical protein